MAKKTFRFIDFVYLVAIILVDVSVYIVLGLFLMGYDDTYDSTKGEYWSLSSMNNQEKVFYIAINVWNVLNIVGVTYLVYRIFRRVKYGT
ncbi:MAG: hypothetical protein C0459_08690 [Chitinophaga sp.]|jgi:hypothetical protein|nr:hypothetical protein [Chitinophaga sp.]